MKTKNYKSRELKNQTVLFVDDSPEMISALKRVMIDEKFNRLFALNANDALEILEKEQVQVIVADMKMPEMDGLTLLRKVKKNQPNIVRMVLTAITNPLEILKSINSGEVFRYVVKPIISSERFISYINDALDFYRLRMIERELLETEYRFRGIFESTNDCIIILNENFDIQYINGSAVEYFGKLKGENLNGLRHEFSPLTQDWKDNIRNVFRDGIKTQISSSKMIRGEKIYFETEFTPINDTDGNTDTVTIIYKDITKIKKLQQELLNSEKMVTAGKMAAGFANEVGNRLASASTSAQLCMSTLSTSEVSSSPSRMTKHLQLINRNLNTSTDILKLLVSFTKPMLKDLQIVDLNKIIKLVIADLHDEIKAKNISIEFVPKVSKIKTDRERMLELFENILLNAIQASSQNQKIQIQTKIEEEIAIIEIHDNGCGISAENMDEIFEPFYTTKENATGMGLATCQQIVTEHGGSIYVQNNQDKGVTFIVKIPKGN
ncbi:MAG: ATP-binding protein [Candidatus Cloacimonadota bacterium]|nr:ATP-binding protein [Candidatus Cloacimonadota bacterium]